MQGRVGRRFVPLRFPPARHPGCLGTVIVLFSGDGFVASTVDDFDGATLACDASSPPPQVTITHTRMPITNPPTMVLVRMALPRKEACGAGFSTSLGGSSSAVRGNAEPGAVPATARRSVNPACCTGAPLRTVGIGVSSAIHSSAHRQKMASAGA